MAVQCAFAYGRSINRRALRATGVVSVKNGVNYFRDGTSDARIHDAVDSNDRSIAACRRRIEALERASDNCLEGHATLYMKPHEDKGWIDIFAPDAFASTLRSGAVIKLLIQHEGEAIAETSNGLELRSDDKGLAFNARLPCEGRAEAAYDLVLTRAMTQMSVACTVRDSDIHEVGRMRIRTIRSADLREISIVPAGAVGAGAYVRAVLSPYPSLKMALI
jgi:HK97 family phage prohead protease